MDWNLIPLLEAITVILLIRCVHSFTSGKNLISDFLSLEIRGAANHLC